jgi:formylglycine-generating enzyme required for sulfatase activity/class 3 adenylate cyclase
VTRVTTASGCKVSSLDIVPREEPERRLAAILVADVVGYSRLMQADEEGTLSRVEEIGASIVQPRVTSHRGHIFRTMGDGLLIEFPSVVEAVLCAAEIQEELRLRGDADPPEQRIQLRIGINVGDVIRKGNDVFGTGVNIAARLESLAAPGSIYISGEAYDQVRDRPFAFDDLGMHAVKNIARLIRVYRVRLGDITVKPKAVSKWHLQRWRLATIVTGSLIGLVIFVSLICLILRGLPPKATTADIVAPPTTAESSSSDEMSAWAKVKRSDQTDQLSSFLDRFPDSRYAEYVRHRLNALGSHPKITKFRDCTDCPEMVVIPPGSFTMGVPQTEIDRDGFSIGDSAPLHLVRVAQPFALGEFLVTRKQYAAFAAKTGHQGSGCSTLPLDGSARKFDPALSWRDPGFTQADDHPVVCVSWDDAVAYTSWLSKTTGRSYRLPSEAEWEYAARAGSTSGRYFGDASICEFANVRDRSKKLLYSTGQFVGCSGGFSNTSPVGSFPPNGFSLYDMLGNAWEWVEDCWGRSYVDAPADGAAREKAVCEARVRRGGGWNSDHRRFYNLGSRTWSLSYWREEHFGFRVASDYPAPASARGWLGVSIEDVFPSVAKKLGRNYVEGALVTSVITDSPAAKTGIKSGDVIVEAASQPIHGARDLPRVVAETRIGSKLLLTIERDGKTQQFVAQIGKMPSIANASSSAISSSGAPQSPDWDGTWIGSWGGQLAEKMIISGGKVVENDFRGYPLPQPGLGQTIISGNTLTFGSIRLTKRGPTTAAAHYHGGSGEADAMLVRGAPQSSDWDGVWIGSWAVPEVGSEMPAKIIISGGTVLEYDYGERPSPDLGQTIISGNTLTFGTLPRFTISLTKSSPAITTAHFNSGIREADGELVRQ